MHFKLGFGGADASSELRAASADAVVELVLLERRRAHLAPYADGQSVDMPTKTVQSNDWNPLLPDRRRAASAPYMLAARQASPAGAT